MNRPDTPIGNLAEKSRQVPDSPCPECGNVLGMATGIGSDRMPSEGDVSVCGYCATIVRFKADLQLRTATADEIAEMPPDVRATLRQVQRATREARREHDRREKRIAEDPGKYEFVLGKVDCPHCGASLDGMCYRTDDAAPCKGAAFCAACAGEIMIEDGGRLRKLTGDDMADWTDDELMHFSGAKRAAVMLVEAARRGDKRMLEKLVETGKRLAGRDG